MEIRGDKMKIRGFTLIELMITIAILAILLGIAYPAYTNYVEKSRRADAISGLLQAAQQMERCFTRNNSYAGCSLPTYNGGSDTSPDGFYNLSFVTQSANSFKIKADPGQAQGSDACGAFDLDQLGRKSAEGSDSDRCWGS